MKKGVVSKSLLLLAIVVVALIGCQEKKESATENFSGGDLVIPQKVVVTNDAGKETQTNVVEIGPCAFDGGDLRAARVREDRSRRTPFLGDFVTHAPSASKRSASPVKQRLTGGGPTREARAKRSIARTPFLGDFVTYAPSASKRSANPVKQRLTGGTYARSACRKIDRTPFLGGFVTHAQSASKRSASPVKQRLTGGTNARSACEKIDRAHAFFGGLCHLRAARVRED